MWNILYSFETMNKQNQTWVDVKDLNPIQQHYIENVMFLQRLSKTGFGEVPTDLFDGLFEAHYLNKKQ